MCFRSPRSIAVLLGLSVSAGLAYGGPVYALNPFSDESGGELLLNRADTTFQRRALDRDAQELPADVHPADSASSSWISYIADYRENVRDEIVRPSQRQITVAAELASAQVIPLPNALAAFPVLIVTLLLLTAGASVRRGLSGI